MKAIYFYKIVIKIKTSSTHRIKYFDKLLNIPKVYKYFTVNQAHIKFGYYLGRINMTTRIRSW